jgi:hypothetical protein
MPLKVWTGSTWQVVAQLKVWNGSSWVTTNAVDNAKTARVWNGSTWKQFHPGVQLLTGDFSPSGTISLNANDLVFQPSTASASVQIELQNNGSAYYVSSTLGTKTYSWLLTGVNSDYYAYMDTPSGDPFDSGTVGTSLQLNTTQIWSLFTVQLSVGFSQKALTSTLRIKNSLGTDIISIPVDMSVVAEVQP